MRIIGGRLKGRRLIVPKGKQTRPTTDRTRENLFNILSNMIGFSGISVLDLFAGTGALGIEAISRGAANAVFVENANLANAALHANIEALGISRVTRAIKADATKFVLPENTDPFALLFADPPYGKGLGERAARNADVCNLLATDALFVLEESSGHLPENLPGFELLDQRHYGNTSIGFYRYLG